jgi:hypothetical protein
LPKLNSHCFEDWERIEHDTQAWWEHELERLWFTGGGRPTPTLPDRKPHAYLTNYPLEMPAALVDLYEPFLNATHYYADAFPWWWINFGPGIAAGFLGSKVGSVTEPSETVWFSPAKPVEIQDLQIAYDQDNAWWQRVQAITAAATERFDGLVQVSHTDLGGNLDILASFRETQGLLFDVLEYPDEVDRLVMEINRLWLRYYAEQEAIIRTKCAEHQLAPIFTGNTHAVTDFVTISPTMFERFVMPDLVACCDHLTRLYHLDGKAKSLIWICSYQSSACAVSNGSPAMASPLRTNGCPCSSASGRAASCARSLSAPQAHLGSSRTWVGKASCW